MKQFLILALVLSASIAAGPPSPVAKTTFFNCPYPTGGVYQHRIDNRPLDPNSANYIKATIDGGGGGGFQAWYPPQTPINLATNSTPMVTVVGQNQGHRVYGPIPYASGFGYQGPGTDGHYAVLNTDTCMYYESYLTVPPPNPNLSVYSDKITDLKLPFVQPPAGGDVTASGIPFGLLAIRPEELAAGYIGHSIGWDGVAGSLSQTLSVNPAGVVRATDGHPYKGPAGDIPMPYGSHARLRVGAIDLSKLTPNVRTIAIAMQQYGLYVFDSGCCSAILLVSDSKAPNQGWSSQDAASLKLITPAMFDIVTPPQ